MLDRKKSAPVPTSAPEAKSTADAVEATAGNSLSPARAALLALQQRIAEVQACLDVAERPLFGLRRAKEETARTLADALIHLADFDKAEQRAVNEWAVTASGSRPMPDVETRRTLELAVSDARREDGRMDEALSQRQGEVNILEAKMRELQPSLSRLMVNILFEEAEAIGERYKAAVVEAARVYAELIGINAVLTSNFHHVPGSAVTPRPIIGPVSPPSIMPSQVEAVIEAPVVWLECTGGRGVAAHVRDEDINRAAAHWRGFLQCLTANADASASDARGA